MEKGNTGRDVAVGAAQVKSREITAAATLTGNDHHVIAVIPLASASDFDITLPPLAENPGQEIVVTVRRATGSYVDGGVQLVANSDGYKAAGLTNDKLTTVGDFWHVRNVAGLWWQEIAELTT